ncbi:sensor histidine kinase [Luteimicrobium sp. NPDC057192]|uniref:sensor histidine kinase n=1 Tax=Luteimicrobium sp. NPDC057192 TaxID=3346042 RepID=UPI0036354B0C
MRLPRPADARGPLTLRRQLVLVVTGVLVALLAVLAVVSTLALRTSLGNQLDDQLRAAAERSANFPGRGAGNAPSADASSSGSTGSDATGSAGTDGDDDASGTEGTGSGDGHQQYAQELAARCEGASELPGGSTPPPGQGAGQIVVFYSGGEIVDAGFFDESGCFVALTYDEVDDLTAVPHDGKVHQVTVGDLGSYRAIATTTRAGQPSVTALPTATMDATIQKFVLLEVGLAVGGLVIAGVVGSLLVRRSLAPLDRVADVAEHVSQLPLAEGEVGALHGVDPRDTDERTEVGKVGAALNRMLDNVGTSLAARHRSETQVRQFVADASHELRTPLASIRGYAELVRRSPEALPDGAARSLDRIESEARRMGVLVDDLLLLARLDAGRPLDSAPVDLTALAVDAVTDAHAAAPDHRYELDLPAGTDDDGDDLEPDATPPGSADLVVVGDEARLRQVLTNLVGNTRVHTPPGTRVRVGARAEDGDVVLTVQDDGPGIPADLVPDLFQRFSRGDTSRNRVSGSTGLGLAIAHAIVVAHHGTIEVESRTRASGSGATGTTGTTFTVRLPRTP